MGSDENGEWGLAGIGKVAKAIPPEVYIQTSQTLNESFNKLLAPIIEITDGFGRLIKQRFDNMLEVEKALAVYTLKSAVTKAEAKAKKNGTTIIPPIHPKSFIRSVNEASIETNPCLHEMWGNLLADQLVNENFHPHFVEILPHFSPMEAKTLMSLLPKDKIVNNANVYYSFDIETFKYWIKNSGDVSLNKWNYSCNLLIEFNFAAILPPIKSDYSKEDRVTILYRTIAGNTFLSAVS